MLTVRCALFWHSCSKQENLLNFSTILFHCRYAPSARPPGRGPHVLEFLAWTARRTEEDLEQVPGS